MDSFPLKYAAFRSYFLERRLAQGRLIRGLYDNILSHIFESTPIVRNLTESYGDAVREAKEYLSFLRGLTDDLAAVSTSIGTSSKDNSKIYSELQELSAKMEQIDSIAATVADIAEQTNVLSINAAIQAARAGDTGKAFAVVATEVRKLSEETQKNVHFIEASTRSITDSVADIRVEAEGASANLESMVASSASIRQETERIIHEMTGLTEAMQQRQDVSASLLRYLDEIANSRSLIESVLSSTAE